MGCLKIGSWQKVMGNEQSGKSQGWSTPVELMGILVGDRDTFTSLVFVSH